MIPEKWIKRAVAAGMVGVPLVMLGYFYLHGREDLEELREEIREHERICLSAPLQQAKISTIAIDQIFRDHDGYRIYSREESGLVKEVKYYGRSEVPSQHKKLLQEKFPLLKGLTNGATQTVMIYRDLHSGEKPTSTIVDYTVERCFSWTEREKLREFYYLEVHLPENQSLSAGIDHWTEGNTLNPVQRYEAMKEIY